MSTTVRDVGFRPASGSRAADAAAATVDPRDGGRPCAEHEGTPVRAA
jgi:hypothetical protein